MQQKSPGIFNPILAALLVGSGTFLMGAVIEMVTRHYFLKTTIVGVADDFLIGTVAGLLVLFYERRRSRYLRERLRIIREMNHHVRNALQIVSYSAQQQQNEQLGKMLRDSTERIEWALREVLQGKNTA